MTATLTALVATIAALALGIPWARRLGLVDHPQGRKDHAAPIPVVGGIAMYLGGALALAVSAQAQPEMLALLFAGLLLVLVGVADDIHDLHWFPRILSQVVAAGILAAGGVVLMRLGVGGPVIPLELGPLAVPFSVFAVVGLINALNMIDGVDGLSGTVAAASFVLLGLLAWADGATALAGAMAVFTAATLGFLAFNIRLPGRARALTFLGNSGSALIGLVLAWSAIEVTHHPGSTVTPALGPWLVAIPILDCLTLIIRRLIDGRSPFSADRGHLHHLMLDRGWSVSQVVIIAGMGQILVALAGWTLHALGVSDLGLILVFIGMIGVHYWLTAFLARDRAAPAAERAQVAETVAN